MASTTITATQFPPATNCTQPDTAMQLLWRWLKRETPISYAYSRAGGELLATGAGVIGGMNAEYLEIRTTASVLIASIRGAQLSIGQQRFFGPQFLTSRDIEGVSVQLSNSDWIFMCPRQDQDLFVHGHPLERA